MTEEEAQQSKKTVQLPAHLTIGDLAELLDTTIAEVIKVIMRLGYMLNVNSEIDFGLAANIATHLGVAVLKPKGSSQENKPELAVNPQIVDENAVARPPVVTVMGHVDHGKTTLLDYIRGSSQADKERGGITQTIGASQIIHAEKEITFIDTPGHKDFTAMRSSGARVTDIVIIVVAADDGVNAQTLEAIDHAKAAEVPMIVAINKMDLENANPELVKSQLYENNLSLEDYGGEVPSVQVSAKTGEGVDDLLDMVLLVSELNDLKANPNVNGFGAVIESHIEKTRGVMVSVILKNGRVKKGNHMVSGSQMGRVRQLLNAQGEIVKEGLPSMPLQVMGFREPAQLGAQFEVIESTKAGQQILKAREKLNGRRSGARAAATMDEAVRLSKTLNAAAFNLIIKAGSQGALDAAARAVDQLSNKNAVVHVIRASTGPVSESDIMLASASECFVVAFDTYIEQGAIAQTRALNVKVGVFDVIFDLIDTIEEQMRGEPEEREVREVLGTARILEVFPLGRSRKIAGVAVTTGTIKRNSSITVSRNDKPIFEGRIASMRHFQETVNELGTNFEGGIMLAGFNDFQPDDVLKSWVMKREKLTPST